MKTIIENTQKKIDELIEDNENYTKFAANKMQIILDSFKKELENKIILSKKNFEFIIKNSKEIDQFFIETYKKEGIKEAVKYLDCIC